MRNSQSKPPNTTSTSGAKRFFSYFTICCKPEEDNLPNSNRASLVPHSSMSRELSTTSGDRGSHLSRSSRSGSKTAKHGVQTRTTYPVNEVFILGNKFKIVAKITKVRVLKNSSTKSTEEPISMSLGKKSSTKSDSVSKNLLRSPEDETNYRKEIFSLYEKGIKADDWEQITPEPIAKHIANRTKADIIIDALCGYGGNTIQFAKASNFVIGIDIDPKKTFQAKENARVYDVEEKIDFITADFFKMRHLSGEIVFLSPSTVGYNSSSRPFSIKDNLKPDLSSLLGKSLEISSCICIKLPKEVSMEDLVTFFHYSLESQELYSRRFCIEIEKIYNLDEEVECLVVYFGDCSSIQVDKEYQAIYDYISANESAEWKARFTPYFISRIIEKIGIRKSFCFISDIEQRMQANPKMHPSLFDNLLEKLIQESFFTEDAIKKIFEAENHRRSPNKSFSLASSPGSGGDKVKSSSLTAAIKPSLSSYDDKKFEKNIFELQGSPIEKDIIKNSLSPIQSANHSPQSKNKSPLTKKNSLDVGELSVSEYSVNSNFLKDDYDEEESSKTLEDSSMQKTLRAVSANNRDLNALGKELESSKGPNGSIYNNGKNRNGFSRSELNPETGELSPTDYDDKIRLEY